jgi:hypothetical protein
VGDRAAVALLRKNPFPDEPPKLLRAHLYRYWFTDRAERRATGACWNRDSWRSCWLPSRAHLSAAKSKSRPNPPLHSATRVLRAGRRVRARRPDPSQGSAGLAVAFT